MYKRQASPGASFTRRAYLRRRGISAELERVRATGRRRGGLIGAIDRMRERAEVGLAAGASPAHAALARGMVLGQDEAIAAHVREDFRRAGLAHLLAYRRQARTLRTSRATSRRPGDPASQRASGGGTAYLPHAVSYTHLTLPTTPYV